MNTTKKLNKNKKIEKEENVIKFKNKNLLTNENNNLESKIKFTSTEREEMKKKERKSKEKIFNIRNGYIKEADKNYSEENKKIKKFVEEYFETSPDEMEYDDAIKKDHRTFCQYFTENLKEKQIIANTFIASDPIKPRGIKIILFSLNIILYFVINGLFISESYISELYYIDEEKENFFSC